jgi:tetratricopeptide (TPR) repeat protein
VEPGQPEASSSKAWYLPYLRIAKRVDRSFLAFAPFFWFYPPKSADSRRRLSAGFESADPGCGFHPRGCAVDLKALDSQISRATAAFYETGGIFALATEDKAFLRCVGDILLECGRSRDETFQFDDFGLYAKKMDQIFNKGYARIILFAESRLKHRHCAFDFQNIKYLYGNSCLVVCLTSNPTKEVSSLYYELGADSIIVKPASMAEVGRKLYRLFEDDKSDRIVARCREKIKQGAVQEASELAQELANGQKSRSRGLTLLGEVFREKGETEKARKAYLKAHSQAPEYLEALQGLVDMAQTDEEKLDYLRKLDAISPMNYSRKIDIGKLHAAMGDMDKADELFEEAVSVLDHFNMTRKADAISVIADFYKSIDINKSIQYMKSVIRMKKDRLGPDDYWMFNEIGLSLRKEGRWAEAIEYYGMALDIGEDAGIYFNIGMAYQQGNKYFKAIENMKKAIRIDPDLFHSTPSVPFNLGMAYANSKSFDKALYFLEEALNQDPEHGPSRRLLPKVREKVQQGGKKA